LELVEVLPGSGKYANSVGRLVVQNPSNEAFSKAGLFAINDEQHDWTWQRREMVNEATIKVCMQELMERGAPKVDVFIGFYEGRGNTEAELLMHSKSLAG